MLAGILLCIASATMPGEASYLTGIAAERAGRHADAVTAFSACANEGGPLAAYGRVRAARSRMLATGNSDAARNAYVGMLGELEPGPWKRMGEIWLGFLDINQRRTGDGMAQMGPLFSETPRLWWFGRYLAPAALAALDTEATRDTGFAFYRDSMSTFSFWTQRSEAALRLAQSTRFEDRLTAAYGMVRSGGLEDALKLIGTLAAEAKVMPVAAVSPLNRVAFDAWAAQVPVAGSVPNASEARLRQLWLYGMARRAVSGNKPAEAVEPCRLLSENHGGSEPAAEALWLTARALESAGLRDQAIGTYLTLARVCPAHYRADDALLGAGRLQRAAGGDGKPAIDTFDALCRQYPESAQLPAACYFTGQLHEAAGAVKKARLDYLHATRPGPGDYYTHLAWERLTKLGLPDPGAGHNLKIDGTGTFLRPLPHPEDKDVALPDAVVQDPRYLRLQWFGHHGLEEGEWEMLGLRDALKGDANRDAWYQAVAMAGYSCTALELAEANGWGRHEGRPAPARQRTAFPRVYWEEVTAMGKETGLDPYLLLAVARQESTFRPNLTSSAGACGVMQLMPKTAEWLDKVEDAVTADHVRQLDVPGCSFRLGAYYLMRMVEKCDGNLAYALASYNAGPGNLAKWRKQFPNLPLEAFIEQIPYTETRGYVKAVLGNYAAYHSLYPPVK